MKDVAEAIAYKEDNLKKNILRNTITLVIKLTHSCNLACEYCFYMKESFHPSNKETLGIEELRRILLKTAQICSNINLVFHGGEPLLIPVSYYEKVLDYQSYLSSKYEVNFNNSIQSNGTILSKKFISLLKKGPFGLGISLDGNKEIHDKIRKFRNGTNSSFKKIMDNISALKANNINISSLVVASKYTVRDADCFYNFFNENDISIKINEMYFTEEEKNLIPTNEELALFMIALFDIWFEDNSKNHISIEPFTTIISSFWGENAGDCCYKSSCTSFFLVETDGSIVLCSRLNFLKNKLGNLLSQSWKEIINSNVIKSLNRRILEPNVECANCKWLKACAGGCTASAFEAYSDMYQKTYWCDSRKTIFNHIYNKLESIN